MTAADDEPKRSRVVVRPAAERDLEEMALRIAVDYDVDTALAYVGRLRAEVASLDSFPRRGTLRRAASAGAAEVRSVPTRDRRYTIVFVVNDGQPGGEGTVRVARFVGGAYDLTPRQLVELDA